MPSPILINVELTEALTASICAHLAVEFFKHMAYLRQQLPFPFKQLVSVLKRRDDEQETTSTRSGTRCQVVQAENEYRKIKGIFDSMQTAFQNLEEELCLETGKVEEVAMILGATPLSPRDVYRFQFPPLLFGHLDSKHPHQSSLLALIRCLISSNELHSFNQPLLPTNMFLLLRKNNNVLATSGFSPKERYNVPTSGKHAIIRLIPPTNLPKCICGGANIYTDDESSSTCSSVEGNPCDSDGATSLIWFQALNTMKGFKDIKINGTPASAVWLQSR